MTWNFFYGLKKLFQVKYKQNLPSLSTTSQLDKAVSISNKDEINYRGDKSIYLKNTCERELCKKETLPHWKSSGIDRPDSTLLGIWHLPVGKIPFRNKVIFFADNRNSSHQFQFGLTTSQFSIFQLPWFLKSPDNRFFRVCRRLLWWRWQGSAGCSKPTTKSKNERFLSMGVPCSLKNHFVRLFYFYTIQKGKLSLLFRDNVVQHQLQYNLDTEWKLVNCRPDFKDIIFSVG